MTVAATRTPTTGVTVLSDPAAPTGPTGPTPGRVTPTVRRRIVQTVSTPAGPSGQLSLDDMGTPLADVTFLVLDLETTGGAPESGGITEIGAVKVRAGEILGEFHTLVNPGEPIPAFISTLTGISNAMVAQAPTLSEVLPPLLDFMRGCVLVAHNAPYDVGFLKGACARERLVWPSPTVLDTVTLARQVVTRDEVPNRKLGTLARHFGSPTTPNHRALDDARATVHVMHALFERVGNLGVRSLEEVLNYSSQVPEEQRRKRTLADGLPDEPGVYMFEDAEGRTLYVGTSKHIRTRVRSYFTSSEKRSRIGEMVSISHRVVPIVCATPLEASIRELRLIAERKPPYNRRSRHPEKGAWLKLTDERFPRLSITRGVAPDAQTGASYIGPFRNRTAAESAAEALTADIPLRSCTDRIGASPTRAAPCIQGSMGRCLAPCTGEADPAAYAQAVALARAAMTTDVDLVARPAELRMRHLAEQERFEEAASWRERLASFVLAADRAQRSTMVASEPHLVAAALSDDGGWDVHVIRHGRLAGACHVPRGFDPKPYLEAVVALSEVVDAPIPPASAALPEETRLILSWLLNPGVRLIAGESGLALPAGGAGRRVAALMHGRESRTGSYPEVDGR